MTFNLGKKPKIKNLPQMKNDMLMIEILIK